MGEPIESSVFSPEDYAAFGERLRTELALLDEVVQRPGFGAGEPSIGAEVEMALVDSEMRPARVNEDILDALSGRAGPGEFAPELDRFCIELDTPPVPLAGSGFDGIEQAIRTGVDAVAQAARALAARPLLVGTLPTVGIEELESGLAITPEARYAALEAGLVRYRADDRIEIDGREQLSIEAPGIALEGVLAALQVHLKVPPERFAATLNAAHLVTAPVLGVCGNSPFVLGRSLWSESRVPLFRQVVDGSAPLVGSSARAPLGYGWTRGEPTESFHEDVGMCPPILPVRFDAEQASGQRTPDLPAIRLHSGTIWRWNRPVFDPADAGHIRLELRALPSGPTVTDMVANAAFLVGSTLAVAEQWDLPAMIPFAAAVSNFDAAARDGLDAQLLWPSHESPSPIPRDLDAVAEDLLPLAADALERHGVPSAGLERLDVVARRLDARATGSVWQRDAVSALESQVGRERALVEMTRAYEVNSRRGRPVSEWPTPDHT